jgi:hypothetical protein
MINSIIKFFTKTKKVKNAEKEPAIETDNILAFIIDKKGDIFVKIIINDTTEIASLRFGNMINNINYGQFENSILDVLAKESDHSEDYKQFKDNILVYWNIADTSYNKEVSQEIEEPYISPLAFSKVLNPKNE